MSKKIVINLTKDQITERLEGLDQTPSELIQACIVNYAETKFTPKEFVSQIFDIMVKMRDLLPLTAYATLHNQRREILVAMLGENPALKKAVNGQCNQMQIS